MEPFYGIRLADAESLDDPKSVLEKIIGNVKIAYQNGYINGDLNEYNIMVNNDNILILDWPQAIRVDTINANAVLMRDVKNILKFFSKKYKIERDSGNTIIYIKGI